jgi:methyl-accepting chemotaxis protein
MTLSSDLQYIFALLVAGAMILWSAHMRLGKGLAFRLFLYIIPIGLMAAVIGRLSSVFGTWSLGNLLILLSATAIGVPGILHLNRSVVVQLNEKSRALRANTAQLGSTAKETATTASQQAAMVTEVSSTSQEIQATSAAAAEGAGAVLRDATEALRVTREGEEAVAEARRIMELIGQAASIVDTVGELAEKSNLLAVNASIEAANAGEYGRRFAVVAAEVRNLAEQSKTATKQIHEAIQRTEQGRRAVDTASGVIQRLSSVIDQTTDKARSIAGATQQQAAGIQQISDAMASVSQGAQESAAAARQIEGAVQDLEGISLGIQNFVGGRQRSAS